MDSLSTAELFKWDKKHVIHPMTTVGADPTVVMEEGDGVYIKDTDGKKYLDGAAQLTCVNLGYNQKEISAPGNVAFRWNGITNKGVELSSGVYFYKITSNSNGNMNYSQIKKMTLLR